MVTVVRSPPNRPLLRRRRAQNSQHKLKYSAGIVGAMREVSMVNARDSKHSYNVEGEAYRDSGPAPSDPDRRDTREVNRPEHSLLDDVHEAE
jgi:hypothetical protein